MQNSRPNCADDDGLTLRERAIRAAEAELPADYTFRVTRALPQALRTIAWTASLLRALRP